MALKLTLTPLSGGERQERTLSRASLSIGRGSGNDWVLADPDQHLSRTHCMIGFEQGQYWLTDLSTNGMLVNGSRTPTQRESRTVLTDGDSVVLGGYRLAVAEVDERARTGNDPFGDRGDRADGPLDGDPLADPLSDPLGDGAPGGAGFHHPVAFHAPATRAADPFDAVDQGHGRGRPIDPGQDLFQGATPSEQWKGPAQRDDAAAVSHAFAAPRQAPVTAFEDIDFDALLGDMLPQPNPSPAPALSVSAPAARPRVAVADPFDEMLSAAPAAPAVPPPPVPPEPTAQPAPALLEAFFEGAGLALQRVPPDQQEAAMRAIGALFRAFTAGTRDVLMSRAEIKSEMRVEQTMIRSRDNNALKFSVSPEEALLALLAPSRPGYKQPLAAVEEAFDDIRSHELAVMAGMQTGLLALLKRFDPALLEARLQKGMLDGIMPGARKARFWELFCITYKDIAREAEDDFHALFGREFARAYTAQINKL